MTDRCPNCQSGTCGICGRDIASVADILKLRAQLAAALKTVEASDKLLGLLVLRLVLENGGLHYILSGSEGEAAKSHHEARAELARVLGTDAPADQPAATETSGCRMACGCARCVERRGRHEDWMGITPSGVPIVAETAPQGAPAREPCLCCSDTLEAPSGNPCPLCLPEQAC